MAIILNSVMSLSNSVFTQRRSASSPKAQVERLSVHADEVLVQSLLGFGVQLIHTDIPYTATVALYS
jgi:hypothetical protein